jgi:hypothetical protein
MSESSRIVRWQVCVKEMHSAVAQAVSRRLPTAAARVRSCGICGGQSGTVVGLLRVLRFPLPSIPPSAPKCLFAYRLHGANIWARLIIFIKHVYGGPPLWSSRQSSWLQIQKSRFDSRRYQIFWEVVSLERGPLSLMSTNGELLGRKSSGSGLENRD